jgi:hypothetical protein
MAEGKRNSRNDARNTATFTPYFWEAYNEVVQPRRFDHYLLRKWGPELGPLGFMIVKSLRDRCYHNPAEGILRDSCEVDMEELAQAVGVSRATMFREFERNQALSQFVRRIEQFEMRGGRPHRAANIYQVSMDDPIHSDDYERYDQLRAHKESERDIPLPKRVLKPEKPAISYESQNETHSDSYESQIETYESQIETANTPSQFETAIDSLPSGGLFTKVSLTPVGEIPPINSPQGEGEDTPEEKAWAGVLAILAAQVQAGEINQPTWHGHLIRLRLASLTETTEGVQAVIVAPSSFTREWVEKRHGERIRAALASVLKRDPETITIEFRGESK